MKLSHKPAGSPRRRTLAGVLTSEHAASSYGQPVLLVAGAPLTPERWQAKRFRIEEADAEEIALMARMPLFWAEFNPDGAQQLAALQQAEARRELARKGGQTRSPARAEASRRNGRKGGRPRKPPPAPPVVE